MFQMIDKKTITVPYIFDELPKVIKDLVFECNYEHRILLKIVLDQLVKNIHCVNCNGLIDCSIMKEVNCCSSECMIHYQDNWSSCFELKDDEYC